MFDIPSEYTGWERQFIKISGDGISKEIIIGNIYRPPKELIEHYLSFINDFSQLLSRLQTNNAEVILAGDFNINILQINEKRLFIFSQLFDGLTENSFYTKITLPTRFSNKHGTLIDNFMCMLTKCTLNTTAGIFTKRIYISDHQSYFIFLNTANPKIATPKYIHVNSLNPVAISIFFKWYRMICDPSGRNQSHVGRVRFLLRAEMHGRAHITDSCFIAFITSKIC